jgi:phosphoribosylaminoimidazolecarboxamide formyltransferase/IMP cyclohydrolase
VWDKEGIVDLARTLRELDVEIVSSGGTAKVLREAGVPVREVCDLTGSAEMLGGRVKTLHPLIHAGILAHRVDPAHQREVEIHRVPLIDLVVCNLYPFEQTVRRPGVTLEEAQENIDIGGPTLIRAAAKNFQDVVVLVDPSQYGAFLSELRQQGAIGLYTRERLAREAFTRVTRYDQEIMRFFSSRAEVKLLPAGVAGFWEKIRDLRYGENPHQRGALYGESFPAAHTLVQAEQLQGKELSFNNYLDLQALLDLLQEFEEPVCAIVKHNNPCGVGLGTSPLEAYRRALECDPVSAFGGAVGFNRPVDGETAREMASLFLEVVLAPDHTAEALEVFRAKKNLRVMRLSGLASAARAERWDMRRVSGGVLLQDRDLEHDDPATWKVVTGRSPSADEMAALRLAWRVVRYVRSNAIVVAGSERTYGIGLGQTSRVEAVEHALKKSRCSHTPPPALGLASDGFFPFPDSVELAAGAGIRAIVQPGGSVRDPEVIRACDKREIAMIFTGKRHFRH